MRQETLAGKMQKKQDEYEFIPFMKIDFTESVLWKGFDLDPNNQDNVREFYNKLNPKSRTIQWTIGNDGSLMIMSVKADQMAETLVDVFGSIYKPNQLADKLQCLQEATLENLEQSLEFDDHAKVDIERILNKKQI